MWGDFQNPFWSHDIIDLIKKMSDQILTITIYEAMERRQVWRPVGCNASGSYSSLILLGAAWHQRLGRSARDLIRLLVDEIQHRALSLQFLPQGRFVFDVLGPDKYLPGALRGAFVSG